MDIVQAVILAIVEGITEFLPISSTGHLILTAKLLSIAQTEFIKSFEITIQLGAILAVVVLYAERLLKNFGIIKKILAAFFPTAVIGFLLYKVIKKILLGNEHVVLISLFWGGVFLVIFERLHREKKDDVEKLENISYRQAILIGLFQSLSVVPGVSRAAATIVGGMLLGLKRTTIVEFSFLLAIPTMAAATGYDLLKNAPAFSLDQMSLMGIGFMISFFVAIFAIKFFLRFIKTHDLTVFGIYRVIIAVLFWLTDR